MSQRTRAISENAERSGPEVLDTAPVKSRRSHKKSHNGCTECKHRHIRCDERQPMCANCESAERVCVYKTPQAGKRHPKNGRKARGQQQPRSEASPCLDAPSTARSGQGADKEHAEQSTLVLRQQYQQSNLDQVTDQLLNRSLPMHYALPALTSYGAKDDQIPSASASGQIDDRHTSPADYCPGLLMIPNPATAAIFTPHHMILLHHAPTVPNFRGTDNRNIVDIAIRYMITAPYLIDVVLAFTAFHLTSIYPGSAADLAQLATQLQTRALNAFTHLTQTVEPEDKGTAVPRFLFSSILGRHVLADTLQYRLSGFHSFIDRFVECINLNRGIIAVTPPAWDYLYNSEVQPFLRVVREAEEKIRSPGNECDSLSRLIDQSDLNDTSIKAYRQAVAVLQWSFDVCRSLSEDDFPQAASAFSVRVQIEFVELLRKQRPEALIILAYYGVLLYRCRGFWAFRDAGVYIVRSVAEQLGTYWQEALAWPLHVLETEPDSSSSRLAPGT